MRTPDNEEILKEAKERFPESKPRYYLDEGQRMGFQKGAKWVRDLDKGVDISKICDSCCDDVNVNAEYVGLVFQWLIDNDYNLIIV